MLYTKDLRFQYPQSQNVLHFPDVECRAGKPLLFLGPSGSGKTSWLHLIAGLLTPLSGDIFIGDTRTSHLSQKEMDAFRGKNIGLVFQNPHFISSLTVLENLLLFQTLAHGKTEKKKALELLASLQLEHQAGLMTQQLSQGEAQRLSLARALIHRPALLLADEPSASLDDERANLVAKLLISHSQEINSALVVVTHDARIKALFPNQIQLP